MKGMFVVVPSLRFGIMEEYNGVKKFVDSVTA